MKKKGYSYHTNVQVSYNKLYSKPVKTLKIFTEAAV